MTNNTQAAIEALEYIRDHTTYMSSISPAHFDTIRAALQSKPVDGWQPIETAPKNKHVQLWGESDKYTYPRVGFLRSEPRVHSWYLYCTLTGNEMLISSNDIFTHPTHWQPLLQPPTEA